MRGLLDKTTEKRNTKMAMQTVTAAFIAVAIAALAGCAASGTDAETPITGSESGRVDGVSSASMVFYEASSLDREAFFEAVRQSEGACTIATVNADGTPNLIVSVPGIADEEHLVFGWAENVTKENIERDKCAVIAYYIYDKDGTDKYGRNRGVRLRCSLEEDEAVLEKLMQGNDAQGNNMQGNGMPMGGTFLRIEEILPLG